MPPGVALTFAILTLFVPLASLPAFTTVLIHDIYSRPVLLRDVG